MKIKEKEVARELRQKDGLSLKDISEKLNVSKSTVSLWVRDIVLTDEQKAVLANNGNFPEQLKEREKRNQKFRQIRIEAQNKGRQRVKNKDWEFLLGCMLYWAEGTKSRNALSLSNSDPDLLLAFKKFLNNSLDISNNDIVLSINCYINNGIDLEEIERYWLNYLGLNKNNIRKTTIVKKHDMSTGRRKNKLKYGVGRLNVYNVLKIQEIYGAIKEYADIQDQDKWLQ